MKFYIANLFLILSALFYSCLKTEVKPESYEEWTVIRELEYPVTDIYFVDELIGFAGISIHQIGMYDDYSKIVKTVDGGNSWNEVLVINSEAEFENITFINDQKGFVNIDELVYITTDGGESWTYHYWEKNEVNGTCYNFENNTIFVYSSIKEYNENYQVVAYNNYIRYSENFGESWNILENFNYTPFINNDDKSLNRIINIQFVDSYGFMTFDSGDIFSSNDGGLTWLPYNYDLIVNEENNFGDFTHATFLSSSEGFLLCTFGLIHSSNSFQDWDLLMSLSTSYPSDLGFMMSVVKPDEIYFTNKGVLSYTNDKFKTNTTLELNYPDIYNEPYIKDIQVSKDGYGYAGASVNNNNDRKRGLILKYKPKK